MGAQVARITRMAKHWQAERCQYDIPQDYWESLWGIDGRKGATPLMEKTPGDFGIRSPTPGCWVSHRATLHDDDPGAHSKVARIVVERLWQEYAAWGVLCRRDDKRTRP